MATIAKEHVVAEQPATAIPYRLRVGVTGHRQLPDDVALAAQVTAALRRVRRILPSSAVTPLYLTIVSSLAEGADRLVAHVVLNDPANVLEVALPLPVDDYAVDFETPESRRAFDDLFARAVDLTIMPPLATREDAYERAGQYVVERCDVLIALWDGQPSQGPGGTAEVVAFARSQHLPLIWIETKAPFRMHDERLGHELSVEFKRLDAYNRETLDEARIAADVERQSASLVATAERAGLPAAALRPFCEWIVPSYARADALAQKYQRRFMLYGAAIFLLAAAATVTVTVQQELLPRYPLLALVEVVFVALNWFMVFQGRDRGRLQQRWIAYRALAERLRSRLFLALAEGAEERKPTTAALVPYHLPEEWVDRAFEEIWRRRPRAPLAPMPVEKLRHFVVRAWLQPQIAFMRSRGRAQQRRDHQIKRFANVGWGLTILVVVLHAFGAALSVSSLLIILAIALPAFTSALRAIVEQREYARNAARYDQIARLIAAMARHMETVTTLADLSAVALEAEAVLLEENRDWVFLVRFRDLTMQELDALRR